jgi:hypothetical protein
MLPNLSMKKYMLLLLGALIGTQVYAQYNYAGTWPSRFRLGVEGGPGLVSFFGNVGTEKTHIGNLGFSAGMFMQYSFNPITHPDSTAKTTIHFGLKTGFCFERKGALTTPASLISAGLAGGNTTIHTQLEYVTMPILVQFTMGRANKVKFYQLLGPYISVLVNQNTIRQNPDSSTVILHQGAGYKKLDVGLSIGLGMEIPIRQQFYIHVEFRQNVGLFNINQTAFNNQVVVQNSSSNLLLGFSYRFTRKKAPKEKE